MSTTAPYKTELLKGDFYGRPFNAVNDVVGSASPGVSVVSGIGVY